MYIMEVTITKRPAVKGSKAIEWEVNKDNAPFGLIWTFRNTRTETNRFHAKTLAGAYANFATYNEAETFMRGEM